jgi:hypothetical protein
MRSSIPIDRKTRAKLEQAGRLTLNSKQIAALRHELKEYALQREAELAVRPTPDLKRHRRKIERNIGGLIEAFSDLRSKLSAVKEPFNETTAMNDEILLGFADVDGRKFLRNLSRLKTYLEEERHKNASGGRPPDLWQSGLLDFLASLYLEAGGRSTAVSRDAANDRKSVFIDFAWVAIQLLPQPPLRPHSEGALAAAWEKQMSPKYKKPSKASRRTARRDNGTSIPARGT